MEMTIKQLADELGVSKDKIKYRVGKLPGNYLVKKNGITYLKSEGIQAIREQVGKNSPGNYLGKSGVNYPPCTQSDKVVELLDHELQVLREQLEKKDKQLEEKDKQINSLNEMLADSQKLLDQQQQLNAIAEQKLLQMENLEYNPPEPQKRSWLNFFKKGNT